MPKTGAPTIGLTPAQLQATEDREDAIRAQRLPTPSRSTTPARCATCGEWNGRSNWVCRVCGLPFLAAA